MLAAYYDSGKQFTNNTNLNSLSGKHISWTGSSPTPQIVNPFSVAMSYRLLSPSPRKLAPLFLREVVTRSMRRLLQRLR
jgi:hypothetical protein